MKAASAIVIGAGAAGIKPGLSFHLLGATALTLMFRHAYNIAHMKDSEVGERDHLYTVDVAKIFRIAEAAGYRGYYSLEWEGWGGAYEGTSKLLEESLKYLR